MRIAASPVNKILAILLFCGTQMLLGQLNNNLFVPSYPRHQWENQALFFHKNSEYFDAVAPGQSLLGAQYRSEIHKAIGPGALLSGGLLVQGLYGAQQSAQIWQITSPVRLFPLLSFRYIHNKQRWQFGNLPGPLSHDLPETLMNYDWAWNRPVEYGIDHRIFHSKILINSWLDWRQLAIPNLSQQEIISAGTTIKPTWFSREEFTLSSPFSALIYHQGGENLVQRKPLVTQINLSAGLRANLGPWEINSQFMYSQDASPQLRQPFHDGWASSSWVKHSSGRWEQALVLQTAHEFSAPLGAPLYSSVDRNQPYTTVRDRCLLQARVHYTHPLSVEGVSLDARLDPMFDCLNQKFLLSAAAFLKVEF
ncbi:MAG: hypothetical protein RL577_721 [Bacteroidota bacterium]